MSELFVGARLQFTIIVLHSIFVTIAPKLGSDVFVQVTRYGVNAPAAA